MRTSGLVAMQKVEGSSPFIRFQNPRKSGVLLFGGAGNDVFFSPISTFCFHPEGQGSLARPGEGLRFCAVNPRGSIHASGG